MEQNFDVNKLHLPVLLNELTSSIEIFDDKRNIVVDCTLGLGGHAEKIIKKLNKDDIFVGFDADNRNLELAKSRLTKIGQERKVNLIFINDNFLSLKKRLDENHIEKITAIYYDLGVSSLHLDDKDRGFSFRLEGPLDMRLDKSAGLPASHIVTSYKEQELFIIFKKYGEEPSSRRIAKQIVEDRKTKKFNTTLDLADSIEKISKSNKTKARIFQAIRIETNKELENIEKSVQDAIPLLDKGGNIFVISFHSLEDRIIKDIFKRETRDCICSDILCTCKHTKTLKLLTKKPILPTDKELEENPRARSAKARLAKKI